MIADLVVSVAIYRSGSGFEAVCPELGVTATGSTPDDARDEVLAAVRRRLDLAAARGELEDWLARAGFVVDGGVLLAERRLVAIGEGRLTVPL